MEIGSVLTRLHNLEILATQQSRESAISTQARGPPHPAHWEKNEEEKVLDEEKENIQDLEMMLARIQIIKSDFDVVAQVSIINIISILNILPKSPVISKFDLNRIKNVLIELNFTLCFQKHRSAPVLIQGLHDLPPLALAHEVRKYLTYFCKI